MTDTEILDWLERNLIRISEAGNPQMDGTRWFGQMRNEARGACGGASYVTIRHPTLRAAVEEASQWAPNPITIAARGFGKTEIQTAFMRDAMEREVRRAEQWNKDNEPL